MTNSKSSHTPVSLGKIDGKIVFCDFCGLLAQRAMQILERQYQLLVDKCGERSPLLFVSRVWCSR